MAGASGVVGSSEAGGATYQATTKSEDPIQLSEQLLLTSPAVERIAHYLTPGDLSALATALGTSRVPTIQSAYQQLRDSIPLILTRQMSAPDSIATLEMYRNCMKAYSAFRPDLARRRALPKVKHLDLSRSDITDEELEEIVATCPNLQSLNLSECYRITGAGLQHLSRVTTLQSLDLSWCRITDAGLLHLRGLTTLQSLVLSACHHITDAGLQHLKGHATLQSLVLSSCSRITDAGLQHLRGLTSLQSLDLAYNFINGAGLRGFTTLQSLNLCCCFRITDAGLQHLRGLTSLQSLDLSRCSRGITDTGLQHLRGHATLQSLNLSECYRITGAGLQHLRGLTTLQSLNLSECYLITDAGLQHLRTALPSLQVIR